MSQQPVSTISTKVLKDLSALYGAREASNMVEILFADMLKIPRTDRLINPKMVLTEAQANELQSAIKRLQNHEPIQHIIGVAHFYNLVFEVNRHTLIPRPETEELVDLIIKENTGENLRVLDIGTGTGCIAIALALGLQGATVCATDISDKALETALRNGKRNHANVEFVKSDILTEVIPVKRLDIVVSNPPYIPELDRKSMDRNVLDFDPDLALFVPDNNPLTFYEEIGKKAFSKLNEGGRLYFEIHERYGDETASLLINLGYKNVQVLRDMQGKDRMIRCNR